MRIELVSLEDGTTACGFRKFAAYATRINPDTTHELRVHASAGRRVRDAIRGTMGDKARSDRRADRRDRRRPHGRRRRRVLLDDGLRRAHAPGHPRGCASSRRTPTSSGAASTRSSNPRTRSPRRSTRSARARASSPSSSSSSTSRPARDPTATKNFWFKDRETGEIVAQPLPAADELRGHGGPAVPAPTAPTTSASTASARASSRWAVDDYLANDGLALHGASGRSAARSTAPTAATRRSSPTTRATRRSATPRRSTSSRRSRRSRERFPHLSQVSFLDDSFMAIPYHELEAFAELWQRRARASRSPSTASSPTTSSRTSSRSCPGRA